MENRSLCHCVSCDEWISSFQQGSSHGLGQKQTSVGVTLGAAEEGTSVGVSEGISVGVLERISVGAGVSDGSIVGDFEGTSVGPPCKSRWYLTE